MMKYDNKKIKSFFSVESPLSINTAIMGVLAACDLILLTNFLGIGLLKDIKIVVALLTVIISIIFIFTVIITMGYLKAPDAVHYKKNPDAKIVRILSIITAILLVLNGYITLPIVLLGSVLLLRTIGDKMKQKDFVEKLERRMHGQ